MRIGFTLDTNFGDYGQAIPNSRDVASTIESMIDEGVLAEKAGFHSIQVPDRHGRTENYLPSPWQVLAILARETHRVALGAYALVNTLYHPMFIAEQCAVLDNLSRGRLYMTWARGYHPGYWSLMGIPRERMLGRFLENVRIIEQAYQGDRFSFHGDFYNVDDALISPQPFQSPHFPFWGGGQLPAAIERCASYSDAWTCDDFPIDPPTWKRQANAYRDAAIERGKKPFIVLMRNGWVADTREKAVTEFGSHFVDEMRFYAAQGILAHHPDLDSPEKITAESALDHNVVGTVQQCIERLEYYEEELGVDYVTMRFRMVTGPSLAKTRDQILRFGDEVVSYFHKKDPSAPKHPAIPSGARW
jgi:alkanesulfonate monooxygenase SsuD/methylene tetrahydromethanopterin reductase-like flavin-dependent oxidoreductase (luciferase family)